MKPNGNLRDITVSAPEDVLRKATKLPPLKKSGKEKHSLYRSLDEEDDELKSLYRRESALDFYDDDDTEDEWEEMDEDDEDDLPEDWLDDGETQDWEE